MRTLNTELKKFFLEYEGSVNGQGSHAAVSYGEPVMIATTKGAYAFKNEDFLRLLPKRKQFFEKTGLKSSRIVSLEGVDLAPNYFLVKAIWNFDFEKEKMKPFTVQAASTYILFKNDDQLRIVFQLDHEDLMEKVKNQSNL
jgi:hypothetical protein